MKLATTNHNKLNLSKGVIYLQSIAINFSNFSLKEKAYFMFHIINYNKQQKEDL